MRVKTSPIFPFVFGEKKVAASGSKSQCCLGQVHGDKPSHNKPVGEVLAVNNAMFDHHRRYDRHKALLLWLLEFHR